MKRVALVAVSVVLAGGLLFAQQTRQQPPQPATAQQNPQMQQPGQALRLPLSPPGQAATQVGGKWVTPEGSTVPRYTEGKWIVIEYGRPILRGRKQIFGSGADYGKKVNDDGPVWRAGANMTTRLKTQVPLVFGGKTLPAGDYSMFVDLKPAAWTLIISTQPYQQKYDKENKTDTWGAYNYDQKFDVLRAPMTVSKNAATIDQFTIQFVNVTDAGGTLQMLWENTVGSVGFKIGQ